MKPNLKSGVFWGTLVTKLVGLAALFGFASPEMADISPEVSANVSALVDLGVQTVGGLMAIGADIAYGLRRGLGEKNGQT